MTNTKPVFHGSDIEKISEYYHIDQNSITNFAGNVNPLGLSLLLRKLLRLMWTSFLLILTEIINRFATQLLSTAMSLLISSCLATVQAN